MKMNPILAVTLYILLILYVAHYEDTMEELHCGNVINDCSQINPRCVSLGTVELNYKLQKCDNLPPTITHVDNLILNCNAPHPHFVTQIRSVGNLSVIADRWCGLNSLQKVGGKIEKVSNLVKCLMLLATATVFSIWMTYNEIYW
jgi:hypothetical protein